MFNLDTFWLVGYAVALTGYLHGGPHRWGWMRWVDRAMLCIAPFAVPYLAWKVAGI